MHGRRTGARDVRRHVRHVELPNPPPQRERLLYQPQRPTQGSNPGSGPEVSRRQSGGSGRASGHPATLGRLPPTLWGAGTNPLTASVGWLLVCGPSIVVAAAMASLCRRALGRARYPVSVVPTNESTRAPADFAPLT